MKQTLFMIGVMAFLSIRAFSDAFYAVLMYYGLAVLRPQALWEWALPKGVRWSFYAALIAIAAVVLRPRPFHELKVPRSFMIMIVLLGGLIGASYVAAVDKMVAFKATWELSKILIMIVVASFAVARPRHLLLLGWMIFICLTYIAYEMNYSYVFDKRLVIFHTGLGGYDNNGTALLLVMGVPFCWFFFFAEERWRRWLYLACALPAVHAVMLSYSRGAMLSALLASVGMAATSARRHFNRTLAVAFVGVIVLFMLAGPAVRDRFVSIGERFKDVSAQSRYMSWRAGVRIAQEYPLLGLGPRNSNLMSHKYGADMEGRTIHNVYIQFAADSGVPAMIVFIALLAAAMGWALRATSITRPHLDDPEIRWLHYTCYAVLWSLVTFSLGGVFLSLETFELYYLLILMAAASPALATEAVSKYSSSGDQPVTERPRLAGLMLGDTSA